jgi:beta-lactamase superfamily II metal-dependent hydrolase
MQKIITFIVCFFLFSVCNAQESKYLDSLPVWQEGCLDIHFINTGCGNSSFLILPDGTTMLIDAGDKDPDAFNKIAPWKVTSPYPDHSLSSAGWIINYIKQVMPVNTKLQIDYALITHFHGDHFGVITKESQTSSNGKYKLSGIAEVGDVIPIKTFIDRGYPDYNFPVDLREKNKKQPSSFLNYLDFIKYQQENNNMKPAMLQPGSDDQITLVHNKAKYSSFVVRGVKVNGIIWTGHGNETRQYFNADSVAEVKGNSIPENSLSLAIKITYGDFDYYAGGDNTGIQGYGLPHWVDVETPISNAVGRVEAATLDHHGGRDGTNENFLRNLQPQVIVEQSWRSDHPGQEVLYRLTSDYLYKGPKDIFATNIQEETKVTLGQTLTKGYKSMFGHVMIRVLPGGKEFYVFVLKNEGRKLVVDKQYGPYYSN